MAYTSPSMHVRERHFLLSPTDCGEPWGACAEFAGIVNRLLQTSFGIAPAQTIGPGRKLLAFPTLGVLFVFVSMLSILIQTGGSSDYEDIFISTCD